MPTASLSSGNLDRAKAVKTTHKLSSVDKAIGHSLDEHDKAHAAAPTPTPTPTTVPTRLILVVAKDYYDAASGYIKAPCGNFPLSDGVDMLRSWGQRYNTHLAKGSPYAINFDVFPLLSQYNIAEMRSPTISEPEKISENFVANFVAMEHPKLAQDYTDKIYAHSFVGIGFNHHAGGRNSGFPEDPRHRCIIGDTEMFEVTGQLHPQASGNGYKRGKSWSHEMDHTRGCYCHANDSFNEGWFGVGVDERIHPTISCYPLELWTDSAGNLITEKDGVQMVDHPHFKAETAFYAPQRLQMEKFYMPFLAKVR